ncbi:hypothetical protein MJ699_07130 [Klebsiella pneumoniae]|nr:hypothetical protein MJ699_07130 [Klebsiella pneumoniae]
MSNAVKHLAGILSDTTPIVLIHNGMGTVEELRGVKQPLLLASTTQAARRDGNVIIHVAQGTTAYWTGKKLRGGLQLSRRSSAERAAGCRLA